MPLCNNLKYYFFVVFLKFVEPKNDMKKVLENPG